MTDLTDRELLAELGVEVAPKKAAARTPREERIIAGFEDILKFRETHGRAPRHGEGRDIFERLYAVRLDRLRAQADYRALLADLDTHGLLDAPAEGVAPDDLDDDALLAELGVAAVTDDDITVLRHVASREERRAADEIASRAPCADFAAFKPLFKQINADLAAEVRRAQPFALGEGIKTGEFFVLGGLLAYVAETGEAIKAPNGESDARLRVVYSNGTESNLLRRSLQRALYKDETSRRITEPAPGPLFSDVWEEGDVESGTIYVLRSLSDHPYVAAHRELIHKIGVTGGKVETRIANAAHQATYLLAEVKVVETYKLAGINRTGLENLLHRVFAPAQIDLTITDRFGNPVRPREWFLVPLHIIGEVVDRIRDGSIEGMVYDPNTARLEAGSASTGFLASKLIKPA
jgi:hypothetical protein